MTSYRRRQRKRYSFADLTTVGILTLVIGTPAARALAPAPRVQKLGTAISVALVGGQEVSAHRARRRTRSGDRLGPSPRPERKTFTRALWAGAPPPEGRRSADGG